MKKCASCTKDLPDAALHCVFCGAKQPPAPATSGGMAKTQMGAYSASDMIEHLKNQGSAPPAPRSGPSSPPYAPPRAQPPSKPQPYAPPGGPAPFQHYPAPAAPAPAAPAAAQAKTLFVPGGGPPQAGYGPGPAAPPQQAPYQPPQPPPHQAPYQPPQPPQAGPSPMGPGPSFRGSAPAPAFHPPQGGGYQPPAPMAPAVSPYSAGRAGRPIEPWKDLLRLMMFVWGGVLLVAFATPLSLDPLAFNWDLIIDGEGTAKLPPLVTAAVGVLALVIAGIPMSPAPRGMIAALLGLGGILTPMILALSQGVSLPWQDLVQLAGWLLLIPSLFVRQEYRDALLPRILITIGALAVLAPYLIPENGSLPLVELFRNLIDAPGKLKVLAAITLAQVVLVVLTLLAWLPAPSSGVAKVFAWLLILWSLVVQLAALVLSESIGTTLENPHAALMAWAPMSAYLVLVGFGLASVIGKQLE